jgi:hypothetical protein
MSDFEDRLRDAVSRRTDDLEPSEDLPERIHVRVSRRRRQRRALAGVVSAAVLSVAVGGVLLARSPGDGRVELAGDADRTTTTTRPSTTGTTVSTTDDTPPGTTSTTTGDTRTTETTEGSSQPATSPTSTTTATTSTTGAPEREAAGGPIPLVGTCDASTAAVVELVVNPDVPSPRCVQVTAAQRLQVRNATDEQVTVSLAGLVATIEPGASHVFDRPVGEYLDPGVHQITVSLYGDSGPEIRLVP